MISDTYKVRVNLGLCALAAAITLAGCAGLPDQRLANEALKRGDTALAERNYKALADLGYSEAQVGLADIKVATRDPSQIKEAEATYRAAAATSPRAQARLGRLLVAKPDSTQAEREEAETLLKQAAKQGQSNTLIPLAMLYLSYPQSFPKVNAQQQIDQWRAAGNPEAGLAQVLLYRTQGTYDQHLGEVEKICKAALNTTDICYVELATVYQKRGQADQQAALLGQLKSAYARGAVPATRVDSVARVLADRSLGQTDEKTAKELLEQVAPANPASWVSLAQLVYDFPELGDTDQLMAYIDKGREAEQPRAELLLGRLYYEGKTLPADAQKAEQHLQAAAEAGEIDQRPLLPGPALPPRLPGQCRAAEGRRPPAGRRPWRAEQRRLCPGPAVQRGPRHPPATGQRLGVRPAVAGQPDAAISRTAAAARPATDT